MLTWRRRWLRPGNGWVAGGILRVLATIQNSDNATLTQQFSSQSKDLASWAKEVIDSAWSQPRVSEGAAFPAAGNGETDSEDVQTERRTVP